ncbi:nitronate monooxygenase [Halosquirtibacter laminarini]|uniref:Nitronate monooxygenase n=1 Tax=Halosquirtibacter laminarini TaxID=3374600 RepID=A0AC61NNM2_9BACT|nr:nitronate monooxygenase [Prolixibacteraceae bacterium]
MKSLKIGNLEIPVPIIQGGMGVGISLSGLASAVANEGGIGVISAAGLGLIHKEKSLDYVKASIEGLKKEIRTAKEKTIGVIGVNIMAALTNFEDMVKTTISEKADIIFAGAGLPLDLPKYLKPDSITKLVPIVSSAKAARIIAQKWINNYDYAPDAIVVEGPKAGGHLGFKANQIEDNNFSLEEIIPNVVKEIAPLRTKYNKSIPVIAAGGIHTQEDMLRIMELGADGVQLGSRFVTTHECDADEKFKQEYIKATEDNIEIIQSPVGMPGRAIKNEFIDQVKEGLKSPKSCPFHCIKTCKVEKSPYCIISALYNAYKGNFKNGYAFAGSNAYKAKKLISVKELFNELTAKS